MIFIAMPFTTQTAKLSLCEVGGMYGVDINGTTITVDNGAMTALKRDGSSLIPASLVNVLKGTAGFPVRRTSIQNR